MWTDLLNGISMLGVFAFIVFAGWKLAFAIPEDDTDIPEPKAEDKDPSLEPWRWY